jgi:hypothetical protein
MNINWNNEHNKNVLKLELKRLSKHYRKNPQLGEVNHPPTVKWYQKLFF